SGKDPDNSDVTDVDTEDTPLGQTPSIDLVKSGTYVDADNDGVVSAGDEIHYTFTVTNTGNVTLTNVVVTDPKVTVAGGPISSMAPGAVDNSTFTATYVITQADINAGNVENTAEVSGKDPDNSDVTDVDTEDTPLGQSSSIKLWKSGAYVDTNSDGIVNVGDHIHYNFTVKNTGNVTLTNVIVTDPKITVTGGPVTLIPGEVNSTTFSGLYAVKQSDIIAMGVYNLATTIGKDPSGNDVSDESEDPNPLDPNDQFYDPLCPDCTFVHLPWAVITAIDDNYGPYNSMDGGTTGSVLNNDYLNGNPVNPSDVTLTPGTPSDPALSMNPNGTINVAPGTPAGTYTYPYTICEIINPTNCDDAVATITVISPDITAIEDNYGPYNSMDGGTTGSVLNNDYLNGNPVNPSDVTLTPGTPSDPALSMNPNGTINVAPGTPAGTYTYPYTICEIINPTNCDDAVATITVISPDITAIEDNYGPYNSMDGGTTGSVLNNDYLNGNPVNPSDVTLTPGTPSDPALSMNPNGTINVAPGTPAGTYTYPYTICEIINPTNCDDAVATITVISPDITAIEDNYGPYNSMDGGTTGSVLNNDYLNGNPVNPSDVTLTPGTPSDPALSMNPNGTINVAPGTPAGTYTYPYTICEIINPTNCDDAVATVIITGVTTVCVVPNLQVLLEGPFKDKGDGQTMTTKLNNLGYLPGQKPVPFFGIPTPVGQPYGIAPWNYAGNEGINYDKSLQGPKAGYAADITDWVLVSLRETTSPSSTVCQKAALLHSDGTVEMISGFDCCEIDLNKQYYVVVEHRNHLIVMSHVKLPISNNSITYDFTSHQSYRGLLGNGQKIIDGKFVMFAGNGDQIETVSSVKDVNIKDKDLWLLHNGENSQYNINDFELNGDVNVQDKNMWLDNNSIFTDVPR
ncbi:MAG TPA: hypothetical protein PK047_04765, partial [Saprospiraceae bacterium]|nr:hypothetical protein [Saprospiraceae bacterium]